MTLNFQTFSVTAISRSSGWCHGHTCSVNPSRILYRVAQKECNTYDQWFQENEGQNKQAVSIIAYKILFPTRRLDSTAVFLRQCHFPNLLLHAVSKVTIDVQKISIVWLPRVKCLFLLCKTKTAWIKRSIHYVILQCYNPGKALKEFPHYLNRDFWYRRSKFWKWHCFRKMAL